MTTSTFFALPKTIWPNTERSLTAQHTDIKTPLMFLARPNAVLDSIARFFNARRSLSSRNNDRTTRSKARTSNFAFCNFCSLVIAPPFLPEKTNCIADEASLLSKDFSPLPLEEEANNCDALFSRALEMTTSFKKLFAAALLFLSFLMSSSSLLLFLFTASSSYGLLLMLLFFFLLSPGSSSSNGMLKYMLARVLCCLRSFADLGNNSLSNNTNRFFLSTAVSNAFTNRSSSRSISASLTGLANNDMVVYG